MEIGHSICEIMDKGKPNFLAHEEGDEKSHSPQITDEIIDNRNHSMPRDGMSEESALFRIVKCSDNEEYKVHGIKNKGRYYIANIQDVNGQVVRKIIVDKLNGKVQFIR